MAVCLTTAMALGANAGDAGSKDEGKTKHELTADQKVVMKDMLSKYDTDKNGKLDKEERAKMSAADKATWEKAFPAHHKTHAESK